MRQSETFYAVQLPSHTRRTPRLAISSTAGPALFYWHRSAVKFKNVLQQEGFKNAKVVTVRATYTW